MFFHALVHFEILGYLDFRKNILLITLLFASADYIFKGSLLKISFFYRAEPEISTSVALIYSKHSSFIPIYILKLFKERFVHISFA